MEHPKGVKRKHTGSEVDTVIAKVGPRTSKAQGPSRPQVALGQDSISLGSDEFRSKAALISPPDSGRDDTWFKNLYSGDLDFRHLGEEDSDIREVLQDGSHIDFSNPASVMQLTKTLLRVHFGLRVDLPPDRLCPPVPNRHNYVLWLKDLIDSTSTIYSDLYDPDRRVVGLDIGTGASAIYPLLGCAQRPWSFVATEVDAKSLEYARENVKLNDFTPRIRIVQRGIEDSLVPLDDVGIDNIDFVMTNPPFYASEDELATLAQQKSRPPNSACTGAPVEMVCEGGEVRFVQRIIEESLVLRQRVQWYTSMLGKQSSLEVLVDTLRNYGITNYAVKAFIQGNKTRRWALGWSFVERRPCLDASRGFEPAAGRKILPHPTEVSVTIPSTKDHSIDALRRAICDTMASLDLTKWHWDRHRSRGVGFADGNVWGRAYRRKKARESQRADETRGGAALGGTQQDVMKCAFGFSISIKIGMDGGTDDVSDGGIGSGRAAVSLRWLQGRDYALFESFSGVLRSAVRSQDSSDG
ncbi:hypothetical protein F5Y15DRAFT_380244 [Xylariaceae sp. FL0016]|nr:hypothetical protein F5Y15DRAFT_380244 [Xylariaceae sp. FL0016]